MEIIFIMFSIEVKKSEKTGRCYCALYVDLGYRKVPLNFDRGVCSEILGISIREVSELPEGFSVCVGSIDYGSIDSAFGISTDDDSGD